MRTPKSGPEPQNQPKTRILAIFGHFWPILAILADFGRFWPILADFAKTAGPEPPFLGVFLRGGQNGGPKWPFFRKKPPKPPFSALFLAFFPKNRENRGSIFFPWQKPSIFRVFGGLRPQNPLFWGYFWGFWSKNRENRDFLGYGPGPPKSDY